MCGGGTFGRILKGVFTGGASEISRAAGVPLDPVSSSEAALNTINPEQDITSKSSFGSTEEARAASLVPAPEPKVPQRQTDPNTALTNELRRRRRGAAGARANLGKTLISGAQGVSDDVFGTGGRKSLIGGG